MRSAEWTVGGERLAWRKAERRFVRSKGGAGFGILCDDLFGFVWSSSAALRCPRGQGGWAEGGREVDADSRALSFTPVQWSLQSQNSREVD